jgi:hypothetical protein
MSRSSAQRGFKKACSNLRDGCVHFQLVRLIGYFGALDAGIPAMVAGALQAITPEQITTCLAELPASLHCDESSAFAAWWGSDERLRRIDALLELPL